MSTYTIFQQFVWKRFQEAAYLFLLSWLILLLGLDSVKSQNKTYLDDDSTLAQVVSERNKSDKKLMSINFTNVTIEKAFEILADKINVGFSYSPDVMPNKIVSFEMSNVQAHTIIYKLLEGTNLEPVLPPSKDVIILREKELEILPEIYQETVTGSVVDAQSGEPLPGVNIVIKGTSTGTATGENGEFELTVETLNETLIFSYIGYESQEIELNGQDEITVEMNIQAVSSQDVVVVGYGVQNADEVTGAISTVNSDDFVKGSVTDAAQLIQGKIAGLNIVTPDANPTSSSQINLRGITTLMASTQPLVLIDGVPGNISQVSPQEIESIDVLKDGSAAAIYGTRGTNGVILITTKKAAGDIPPTIEVNSYVNTQVITRRLDFLNAAEYREIIAEGYPGTIDGGADTDWLDEVTQNPLTQNHDISLMGGTNSTNYTLSLRYSDQQGIMVKSNNKVIQPRLSVNHRMFEGIVDINANISGSQQTHFAGVNNGSYNPGVYYNALIFNPTNPVRDENGVFVENINRNNYANPVALIQETRGEQQNNNLRLYGSVNVEPLDNFTLTFLGSREYNTSSRGYYETSRHISTVRDGRNGWAGRGTSKGVEDLFEITGEYLYTISNMHDFRFLSGYTWNLYDFEDYTMTNYNFPSDDFGYNNIGAGTAITDGESTQNSYREQDKLVGYFGRINYNYDNRYLLMASIRREGSSKFGIGQKWGNFPAASVGWNVSNEEFMSNWNFLSNLRIRAGYGVTGTVPSTPYMSLSRFNFDTNVYVGGEWVQAVLPSSNPNPNLKWETKEEVNIGLDFGLFNDRVSGNIDVYERNTNDMLWNYSVPTPPFLFNTITANAAEMMNRGIEVAINTIPIQRQNFQWSTSVNYSTNKNEVTSLSSEDFQLAAGFFNVGATGEPIQQPTHRVEIGQPIGNFYGFKTVDIDENGYWIIEDENGNAIPISEQQPDDRQIIGNGLPNHYLNWNNSLYYKNFDLEVQMRGAFDFQILNQAEQFYSSPVMTTRGNLLNSAFEDKFGKRPLAQDQDLQYVSYHIENGDYFKISNVTVGYRLDEVLPLIQNARIYFSASNIATFTGYSGIDPEVNVSGLNPGIDNRFRYPATRTFTLGISLTI